MKRKIVVRSIGFLSCALLGFGIYSASEKARREQSEINLKECQGKLITLGRGLQGYFNAHGRFPPDSFSNPTLPPEKRLSWLVKAWPFLGDGQVEFLIDESQAWDSPTNRHPKFRTMGNLKEGMIESIEPIDDIWLYQCPCGKDRKHNPAEAGPMDYMGITGVGKDAASLPKTHPRAGVFGNNRFTTVADVKDGLSSTMALCESGVSYGPWTAAGKATMREVDPANQPYLGRGRPFGGLHSGGANVLFLDGSVRFVRDSVSPRVFEATATIAGGEPVESQP